MLNVILAWIQPVFSQRSVLICFFLTDTIPVYMIRDVCSLIGPTHALKLRIVTLVLYYGSITLYF